MLSHVVLRRQGATWLWPPRSQHISAAANHRSNLQNELLNGSHLFGPLLLRGAVSNFTILFSLLLFSLKIDPRLIPTCRHVGFTATSQLNMFAE